MTPGSGLSPGGVIIGIVSFVAVGLVGLGSPPLAIFMIFGLPFYFLPAIIAELRGHHQALAIDMTNLLLGWSGIGWAVALIWACTAVRKEVIA